MSRVLAKWPRILEDNWFPDGSSWNPELDAECTELNPERTEKWGRKPPENMITQQVDSDSRTITQ